MLGDGRGTALAERGMGREEWWYRHRFNDPLGIASLVHAGDAGSVSDDALAGVVAERPEHLGVRGARGTRVGPAVGPLPPGLGEVPTRGIRGGVLFGGHLVWILYSWLLVSLAV